mmetsp:Transcript_81716/g.210399  ORF Transcript_81716/g.210399 Transcript_81716/m.210399 type:complete len:240 (-) Transcript_81716:257-976(-)
MRVQPLAVSEPRVAHYGLGSSTTSHLGAAPWAPSALSAPGVDAGAHARGHLPKPPASLMDRFPTPDSVAVQKAEHERGLDEQLHFQIALLMQKHQATLEFLRANNEQQKKRTEVAIDQQAQNCELELEAKYNEQMMLLAQATSQRKFELERQSNTLLVEYNARKAQEELLVQDYEVHRRYFEASQRSELECMPKVSDLGLHNAADLPYAQGQAAAPGARPSYPSTTPQGASFPQGAAFA